MKKQKFLGDLWSPKAWAPQSSKLSSKASYLNTTKTKHSHFLSILEYSAHSRKSCCWL